MTIIADSATPLHGYNATLDGPSGPIDQINFVGNATSLGNNRWEYDIPYYDQELSIAGTYKYSQIQVIDNNGQMSDIWTSVVFQVKTPTPTPYVDKPVISTLKMDKSLYTQNDTYAIMTVVVNSQTPITKKYLSLEDPHGSQVVGKYFTDQVSSIGNDQWTFQIAYPIVQLSVSGNYTWDQIQITNANNVTSDEGSSVSFMVVKSDH